MFTETYTFRTHPAPDGADGADVVHRDDVNTRGQCLYTLLHPIAMYFAIVYFSRVFFFALTNARDFSTL